MSRRHIFDRGSIGLRDRHGGLVIFSAGPSGVWIWDEAVRRKSPQIWQTASVRDPSPKLEVCVRPSRGCGRE